MINAHREARRLETSSQRNDNMNSKVMAVLAAMAMVLTCTAIAMDDSEAAGESAINKGTILVPVSGTDNGTADASFAFTENELKGYDYEIEFKVGTFDGSDFAPTDNTAVGKVTSTNGSRSYDGTGSFSGTGFTADVSYTEGTPGAFILNLTGVSSTASATILVTCSAVIKDSGNTVATLAPLYYSFTILGYDSSSAADEDAVIEIGLEDVTATVGKITDIAVTSKVVESDYFWYATGLPAGLSMSTDGHIVGTPLADVSSEADNVTVYLSDKYSNTVIKTSMKVTVTGGSTGGSEETEGQENNRFSYVIGSGEKNQSAYYVVSGTQGVKLTITQNGSPVTIESVTAIDSNGDVTPLNPNGTGTYALDVSGTGTYKIVMTNSGDSHPAVTKTFYLYVVPVMEDVSADITITA